jgi:Sulfotransferase family
MLPNFIVIGAAKAGTTALYWYLAEHPHVFMSPLKETNFFAFGLDPEGKPLYGDPEVHHYPVQTLADYEQLFAAAGNAKAIGEASPIYLECPQAAGRIRALIPRARIICCLRNPVDRAYSDYQMYLRSSGQRLDPARDLMPGAAWVQPDSHWMEISRYHAQLQRYFDAFPREQIHVFLFDDFRKNSLDVTQDVYRFLNVDPTFVPDMDTPHNVGGMPSSMLVEGLFTSKAVSALKPWIPKLAASWVRRLRTRNMRSAAPMPPEMKRQLMRHFEDDIARTGQLIGRDLSHWL